MRTATSDSAILIAEIGVNHNGSLPLAKDLVVRAKEAGADYAKFQTFTAADLVVRDAGLAAYQRGAVQSGRQLDLLATLALAPSDFEELVRYCSQVGIGFLTTAHDLQSAQFVFNLESEFIKIPSGDVTNYPFLELVAQQKSHVLLSTGASQFSEVVAAIEVLEQHGLPRSEITVMQCTTEYPAPLNEANLRAMVQMGVACGVAVGYSDHTLGQDSAIAAVALGATVIEKHITLDRGLVGPDHAASLEPAEFKSMVDAIRRVEQTLGVTRKSVTPSEAGNVDVIRKSIVASRVIEVGEVLGAHNLTVKRPGTGTSPMLWPDILGLRAGRQYLPDEMIELP